MEEGFCYSLFVCLRKWGRRETKWERDLIKTEKWVDKMSGREFKIAKETCFIIRLLEKRKLVGNELAVYRESEKEILIRRFLGFFGH